MGKLVWDQSGQRHYEAGIDRGVIYPNSGVGVAWNGLVSVDEKPSGGEAKPYYIDGMKYLNMSAAEEYAATVKAFTYPDEFAACDGSFFAGNGLYFDQQPRQPFDFVYRTRIGNDVDGTDHGYKIHLVYNALVTPAAKTYGTLNASADASDFSWDLTTTQRTMPGRRGTSHLIVDSTKTNPYYLSVLEAILYGTPSSTPRLPSPVEMVAYFATWPTLVVRDNGDGSWTAIGPNDVVYYTEATAFEINRASAIFVDADSYTVDTSN